jgi:hypothetical protein
MDMREYAAQNGFRVEILEDLGLQTRDDDEWQHHAYRLRVHNAAGDHFDTPWRQGTGITTSPDEQAGDILDSLVSDAWDYQQADSFEEWADNFGYDTDSRTAEKLYNQCGATVEPVVRLLGGQEQFEYVATEVDRL